MKIKAGSICITAGTVLAFAALLLNLHNHLQAENAGRTAAAALKALAKVQSAAVLEAPDNEGTGKTMPAVRVGEHEYIGCLSIPALEIDLPVLAQWSDALLELTACRYNGGIETGDLVVAAHNYRGFFGELYRLAPGDEGLMVTMDGAVLRYEVAKVENLSATSVAEMLAAKDSDLTLFTCTYGGEARVTVRCKLDGSPID